MAMRNHCLSIRLLAIAVAASLLVPPASAADTDGDGLLDLIDVSAFDPNATGWGDFSDRGIEDLDGANLLTNLESLDLGLNRITSLESGDFDGLTNLGELSMSGNPLVSIESGAFHGLTNLVHLDLYETQLSSVESGPFSGLSNLQNLHMLGTPLSSIESGAFDGLTNLVDLEVETSSIASGVFRELTNLASLDLGATPISSIGLDYLVELPNLQALFLGDDQLKTIESDFFTRLSNLRRLRLGGGLTTIEPGAFGGMPDLQELQLGYSPDLTELNLSDADFSNLAYFGMGYSVGGSAPGSRGGESVVSVSLRNTVLTQSSFAELMGVGPGWAGIGEFDGTITNLDLSGIDFANITDLAPLYVMDDLTDLWLVNTQNLAASDLDLLLDNLTTIEGPDTEGILHMTQANFDAFNVSGSLAAWDAEPGHHVEFFLVPAGDFNIDGLVDAADINLFTTSLLRGDAHAGFDLDDDGSVDLADRSVWVHELKKTWYGDANLDGEFNSGDLIITLAAGTFEADVDAGWSSGDWNGDGKFTSADLIVALADGGYEAGPRAATAAVPEPSTFLLLTSALGSILLSRKPVRRPL